VGWLRHGAQRPSSWVSLNIIQVDHSTRGSIWVVYVHDIDAQRRAEAARRAAEEELQRVNDALADAVFSVAMPARRIRYANRAVESMLGFAPSECVGQTTRMFYPDDDAYNRFGAKLREALAAGESKVLSETRLRHRDGQLLWVSIATTFIKEGGNLTQVISVVRDISVRKSLEGRLLNSQKLEAVGTLAGGIAHDMNNVLGAILGLASLLERELAPGSPERADISELVLAARRGKGLVENLLSFARQGEQRRETVDLGESLGGLVRVMKKTFPARIQVSLYIEDALPPVTCDPHQIATSVMNLCLNAVDAMPDGGSITVRIHSETADGPAPLRGRQVVIEVHDTGEGMDDATHARAFDPFFTTKEVGRGTGLGLAMVYGAVQNHKGTVQLDSTPGVGTCVRITLPAEPAAAPSPQPPASQATPSGRGRILVVDDEEIIRRMSTRVLRSLGYEAQAVSGGREALALWRAAPQPFDLVLMDLAMPDMDGEETFAALQAIDPEVKVIICSGYLQRDKSHTLREMGARALLHKPFEVAELDVLLKEALGTGEQVSR
jgi:two-component system cell cycle sensor histidine kinase/response regulator CckA